MEIKELADLLVARLDKLDEKVEDARTTLAAQARDIAHHISRTDALEQRVEQVAGEAKQGLKDLADEVKPLQQHAWRVKGAIALVGLVATVAGLVKLFTH